MNIDLIQQEIDSRKKEKGQVAEQAGIIPADQFLYQLQESLKTGQATQASTKLRMVKDMSDGMQVAGDSIVKKNTMNPQMVNEAMSQVATPNVNPNPQQYTQPPQQNVDPNAMDPREEQFYKNLNETKQLLGNNSQNMGVGDALSAYMKTQPTNQQVISSPNALNEAVQKEVLNFMANIDLSKMVEDAVKTTMMEMYQKEKVGAALNENADMIQKMVVNTIIQLKKQNTKQTTKQTTKK